MKRFLSLAASMIVMLLAASCAKEQLGNEASGEATMTLTVSLPDNAVTKAYGDGQYAAKNVIIGVFDENGTEKFRKNYVWEPDVFTKELSITFVMGKKYQMVLWAQYGEAYGDPAKMPLDKISLDYKASNREDLDAFYAYVPTFEVREDFTKSITLTRPFAQLNFATTVGDMDESIAAGDLGIHNKAAVTVANVANTLNLLTGKTSYVAADGTETAAGAAVVIPETEFPKVNGKYPTIVVEETTYEVISMNYVLVADNSAVDGKTTVDLKLKVGELEIEVPTAPMKRNYRTNVIGELLTGEGTFTVTIDPIFDGTYNENWNDGSSDEDVVTKTSEWTLLGTHNEWKSDSKMLLENGLAVAKNVVFPATKAVGDHQFKLYKSVAGENGAAVETWVGMSAEAVVPADKYVAAVVGTAGKEVNIAAGTYDIWFDEASEKIYVMTPEKAIKEATEFVAETPEDPDQPVKSAWGIVGSMTSWGGTADAPVADIIMYVEGDYQVAKGVAVAADDEFKFRTNNTWGTELTAGLIEPDKAYNVAPGSNNIKVSAAGTYDFYLDVVNNKVYMMTEGKTPADAEVAADYWGVIGTVKDNNWATDVKMTLEGDWYVAKAVELVADANNSDKVVFKFRKNGAWNEQRSTSETAPITLGTEYPTVSNGDAGDIQLSAAGTYDIYLSADLTKFKVVASANTEEPEQPEQPEQPDYEITTVAEFLAAAEDETIYTLSGTITSVANTTYGNFNLTDDTGTVYIYGLYSPEGAEKYWAESGAKLGDDIVIKTVRTSFNNSPQGKNAIFVSLASPGTRPFMNLSKTTVSFTAAGGSENVDLAVYNWTEEVKVTSDNEQFSASYSEGKLTIIAKENNTEAQIKGTITISVGNETETVNVIQAVKSTGESKTIEVVFKDLGYANEASVDDIPIEVGDVTFVFAKGGASTSPAYYTNGEAIRMYQNGATLDVSAGGKVITSIEITFANNQYYISADSGELTEEAETRIWTGEATNVKFTSTGTDKSHRAYVKAIKVTYQQ